jgi:phospholipid/cholesterol/gamma-HCH transport system substrate-binding protein
MARRNAAEVATGAVVLVVAGGFLAYAIANNGRSAAGNGYTLHAQFNRIDGLATGADVRLAGVKVGSVMQEAIDPKTFMADVTFTVSDAIRLPRDSSAAITSNGLLGGMYLSLVAGGDERTIPPGGAVTITQSAVNLEDLLGKFIFSASKMVDATKGSGAAPGGGAAAPAGPPGIGGRAP